MCFANDYDWIAEVQEESEIPATKPARCIECGVTIPIGETAVHLRQQEHEECYACAEDDRECDCDEPDYGETYECWTCLFCNRLRRAVRAVEESHGCNGMDREPLIGDLWDAVRQSDDRGEYFAKAIADYPEITEWFVAKKWGGG